MPLNAKLGLFCLVLLEGVEGLTSGTVFKLKSRDGNIAINVIGITIIAITTRPIRFS